ncbi:hypothetical protein PUN28_010781 [Cardiocondyla obscurior]|uniref:Uncharacterized protein n=1 Tax=Cardiocondyla obscurior TaxID=286306 RepID=A0AAW2FJZ6_9HYME
MPKKKLTVKSSPNLHLHSFPPREETRFFFIDFCTGQTTPQNPNRVPRKDDFNDDLIGNAIGGSAHGNSVQRTACTNESDDLLTAEISLSLSLARSEAEKERERENYFRFRALGGSVTLSTVHRLRVTDEEGWIRDGGRSPIIIVRG